MGRRFLVLLTAGAAAGIALTAQAQTKAVAKPDAARGQQIASQVCVACHAADGNSTIPGNPRLAQQHADYLYKQLVDYSTAQGQAKPARENPVMNGFASQLSDADKRNVAAWFASQSAKPRGHPRKIASRLRRMPWPGRLRHPRAVPAHRRAARGVHRDHTQELP
jgi:cytochrome c553